MMPSSHPQKRAVSSKIAGPRILFLLSVLALLLLGLVMVYSATSATLVSNGESPYTELIEQAIYIGVGVILAIVVWRVSYHVWTGRFVWVLWGIGIALLLWTAFAGVSMNGATRWVQIGSITIQCSEFIKIILLLMTVYLVYNVRSGLMSIRLGVVLGLITVLIPLVFLYRSQSDLGTTLICAVGIIAVMWLGGVSRKLLIAIIAAGVAVIIWAIFGTDYRSGRLAVYQSIRSFYAFAEGGIFGVGLGNSHEKFQYLFASESDFIFSVIGEELGMVGALFVIALFVVMLYAGFRIAQRSSDELGFMLAGGLTIMIVFQAFLNMGCAVGVFPTTGKPLPFVSSGGSSIISSLIIVGLIMSVSRGSEESPVYEQRRADLRIVRAQNPQKSRARAGAIYEDRYAYNTSAQRTTRARASARTPLGASARATEQSENMRSRAVRSRARQNAQTSRAYTRSPQTAQVSAARTSQTTRTPTGVMYSTRTSQTTRTSTGVIYSTRTASRTTAFGDVMRPVNTQEIKSIRLADSRLPFATRRW